MNKESVVLSILFTAIVVFAAGIVMLAREDEATKGVVSFLLAGAWGIIIFLLLTRRL